MENPVKREWLISSRPDDIRDHYKFLNITLGEGSYGFVKVATRIEDSVQRAIKIIPKKRIKRPELLTREVSIMKTVDHPNIVKLYETYEDLQYIYLTMEICEGGELFDKIIELGRFSEQQACRLFLQMISAIAYLHSRDIVHRDLKPENFLFSQKSVDSNLKLIDFGLAKSIGLEKKMTTKTGTCYYVSPEILSGPYTKKCDIWSLGVILFMMLSGYPPFDGDTDRDILNSVKNSDLSFSEPVWNTISGEAKDMISHLLDRNPETRYSANEVLVHPWITEFMNSPTTPAVLDARSLRTYQNSVKFRKTVLNYMATQCSSEEIAELVNVFIKIDTNRDGTLSLSEIQAALNNSDISMPELETLIKCIDHDGSGSVDLTEFIAATMGRRLYMSHEKLWNAFKRFDINDTGRITANELKEVLDQENLVKDPQYWVDMVKEVDLDGDGTIDFEEFVQMMEKVSIQNKIIS
jgi:calcium-dependent protein kinase